MPDSCLRGWIARADVDAGTKPGVTPMNVPNLSLPRDIPFERDRLLRRMSQDLPQRQADEQRSV